MSHHESVYKPDAIEIYLLVRIGDQLMTLAKATDHIYDCCDEVGYTGVILARIMEKGDREIKQDSGEGIFGESEDGAYQPIHFKEISFSELNRALANLDRKNVDDEYRFSIMEEKG